MALELIRNVGGDDLGFWGDEDAQLFFDTLYLRHVVVSAADLSGTGLSDGWETGVFPADETGLVDIEVYALRVKDNPNDYRAGVYAAVEGRDHQGAVNAYNDLYGLPKPYDQDAEPS